MKIRRRTCQICGEPTGETYVEIRGIVVCEECINDNRHYNDDYFSGLEEDGRAED